MHQRVSLLLLVLAIAIVSAEPPHFKQHRPQLQRFQRIRTTFARQEVAPVASAAPYPTANELKPQNPFNGEEEASEPELVYGPPDDIYGPPLPSSNQLPSAETPPEFAPNPEVEEFAPARFTQQRPQKLKQQRGKPQRLQPLKQQQEKKKTVLVHSQRLVANSESVRPSITTVHIATGQGVPIAPVLATPPKIVVNSQRLVAAAVPAAGVTSVPIAGPGAVTLSDWPVAQSYVVVNSPHAYTTQFQSW